MSEADDTPLADGEAEAMIGFLRGLSDGLRDAKQVAVSVIGGGDRDDKMRVDPDLFLALYTIDRHALALSAALAILADNIANEPHADETPAPEPELTPDTPDAPEPFVGWSGVSEGGTA